MLNKVANQNTKLTLDDLINDPRLSRLFSDKLQPCAIQLWILEVPTTDSVELKLAYGRIAPYSEANNSWDYYYQQKINSTKITRLNLYVNSNLCSLILRELCHGINLTDISNKFKLAKPDDFDRYFGNFSLSPNTLAYKPISYLLNKSSYTQNVLLSPHQDAGALSASIVQLNKETLLMKDGYYNASFTQEFINQLNVDTGKKFNKEDKIRLGDIEMLVFPTLNEKEQDLLSVGRFKSENAIMVSFDSSQLPDFDSFQINLKLYNSRQIIYSQITSADKVEQYQHETIFQIEPHINAIFLTAEIEIYGFKLGDSRTGTLCSRWKMNYIREISLNGTLVTSTSSPAKFSWLETNLAPSSAKRLAAVSTPNTDNPTFTSQVGDRDNDLWVDTNQLLSSLLEKVYPPKSEAVFIRNWASRNKEARLDLIEWFQKLLKKYSNEDIIIFDPYIDGTGSGIIALHGSSKSNYTIFTSLQKGFTGDLKHDITNPDKLPRTYEFIDKLKQQNPRLSRLHLKVFGLPKERLHDRYILIMGRDGLPMKGFHLSCSLQKTFAEKLPLLITPIPQDALLALEKYSSDLIREAKQANNNSSRMKKIYQLYDSREINTTSETPIDKLSFLNHINAGSILSKWTNESSLAELSGSKLKSTIENLGLLSQNNLHLKKTNNFIAGIFTNTTQRVFAEEWPIVAELLAHSYVGSGYHSELDKLPCFLKNLRIFLKASIQRPVNLIDSQQTTVANSNLLTVSLEKLLQSPCRLDNLYHIERHRQINYSEYFAIVFLWHHDPKSLIHIAEKEFANLPSTPDISDVIKIDFLNQVIHYIAMAGACSISDLELSTLLKSQQALFKWMGFLTLERIFIESQNPEPIFDHLKLLTKRNQILFLEWMISKTHPTSQNFEKFSTLLIPKLFALLPAKINFEQQTKLTKLLRRHSINLMEADTWFFNFIMLPLLNEKRIRIKDLSAIWLGDLLEFINPRNKDPHRYFTLDKTGQALNYCAYLFSVSGQDQQQLTIETFKKYLKVTKRVIQQPLASSYNWKKWDNALDISMYILAISTWMRYYSLRNNRDTACLEEIIIQAQELALRRPITEWKKYPNTANSQLAAFLEQGQQLPTNTKRK